MGFKRYKGPVTTLEQASFADFPVRITCMKCGHFRQVHAHRALRLLSARNKDDGVKLFTAVEGLFKCGKCSHGIVRITAPMPTAW